MKLRKVNLRRETGKHERPGTWEVVLGRHRPEPGRIARDPAVRAGLEQRLMSLAQDLAEERGTRAEKGRGGTWILSQPGIEESTEIETEGR